MRPAEELYDLKNDPHQMNNLAGNVEYLKKQGELRNRLFEHLKNQISESSELVGLRLYVDKGNHSAQQVYKRLGMSAEHYDLYEFMKY